MAKVIFDRKGVFIKYKEDKYKTPYGVVPNRSEMYTKLWWELKEVIKGKDVRVIVLDNGEDSKGSKLSQHGVLIKPDGNSVMFFGYGFDVMTGDQVEVKVGDVVVRVRKGGSVEVFKEGNRKVQYDLDYDNGKVKVEVV